ncbi:MAG TPA: ABC transporter ATP-binding protein [Candidatus Angelobacter sp.]|nr:ABC transporter ATP-binding protein [Candidatus Angelobacter sp.]
MIRPLWLLLPYLVRYWRALLLALLAMGGEVMTAVLNPIPVQRAVDHVVHLLSTRGHLGLHDLVVLLGLAGLLVLIALLDTAFTYFDLRHTARIAQLAVTDLRRALFSHLQRLSLSFHQAGDTRIGDLQVRLGTDVQALQDLVASSLSTVITNAGAAIVMILLLTRVNHWLGFIAVATSLPVILVAGHFRLRIRNVSRQARRQEGKVSALMTEALGAAKLVQAYGGESEAVERLHRETTTSLQYGLEAAEYQARVQPLVGFISSLVTGLMLLAAAIFAMEGSISVGQLTVVLAYTKGTLSALRQLAKVATQTQKASVGADRVHEILSRAPAVQDPIRPRKLPDGPLAIIFDQVTFGYSAENPVLTQVSWHIPAGAAAALIGPSGAGKTTLLSLIPRFYDVWSGRVVVGGIDVRELALADLRAHVTLVLQDALLLRDSVWNNIAYGRPGATRREILAAAEAAGVMSFIGQLENGFETMISERGTTLSGGQKQCIAIARALLRNTPIVLMDEPTSSMDQETERIVLAGMRALMQGRTTITIAHRPTTIAHANMVAIMDDVDEPRTAWGMRRSIFQSVTGSRVA